MRWRWRWTVAAVTLAACGGQTVASAVATDASPTCVAYAEAYCSEAQTCTNGERIVRDWGDLATCVTRQEIACSDSLAAPRTGASAALVAQCTSALPGFTCEDFLDGTLPEVCNPRGPGASGAPCTFNAQCASGYCGGERNGTCGACADVPQTGDSCASSSCGPNQACVWNQDIVQRCEPYQPSGSTCGAYSNPPCAADLGCAGASSTTGASGVCMPGVALGGSCGSKNLGLNCDSTKGLWCIDDACIAVSHGGGGAECGYVGSGLVECASGTCYSSEGPFFTYAGPQTGTCKAFAADGAACDTALGPGCMSPARCVLSDRTGGTLGVCTVPVAPVSAACK